MKKQQSGKEVALRIFPQLVRLAHNHNTQRYGKLAKAVGWGNGHSIKWALRWLMYWCDANGLPALTCLIVNSTGLPGPGLITVGKSRSAQLAAREKVFAHHWETMSSPTIYDLER